MLFYCLDKRKLSLIPPLGSTECRYISPLTPSGNMNEGNYDLKLYKLVIIRIMRHKHTRTHSQPKSLSQNKNYSFLQVRLKSAGAWLFQAGLGSSAICCHPWSRLGYSQVWVTPLHMSLILLEPVVQQDMCLLWQEQMHKRKSRSAILMFPKGYWPKQVELKVKIW